MIEFNIDLGSLDVFTRKNFNFDVQNYGSADLQVDTITYSSDKISLNFTKTPFFILQNTSFSVSGYLKITNFDDSTNIDYIDFGVSQKDEFNNTRTDTYRYWLNYKGAIISKQTQIITTDKIHYINNMLVLCIETIPDDTSNQFPNIIIKSIDDVDVYVFPKTYKISDNFILYVYKDNNLINKIIDNEIVFNVIYEKDSFKFKNVSYRSI